MTVQLFILHRRYDYSYWRIRRRKKKGGEEGWEENGKKKNKTWTTQYYAYAKMRRFYFNKTIRVFLFLKKWSKEF